MSRWATRRVCRAKCATGSRTKRCSPDPPAWKSMSGWCGMPNGSSVPAAGSSWNWDSTRVTASPRCSPAIGGTWKLCRRAQENSPRRKPWEHIACRRSPGTGRKSVPLLPPKPVQIPAAGLHAHHFYVCEQLMFMVDQVLQIAQQQCQDGFSIDRENRAQSPAEVRIAQPAEPFLDARAILPDAFPRLILTASVIHGEFPQLLEVPQALCFGRVEHRAYARQALQEVAQQHPCRPRAGNRRHKIQTPLGQDGDKMIGPLNLLVDLGPKTGANRLIHRSSLMPRGAGSLLGDRAASDERWISLF